MTARSKKELIEILSDQEHERWSKWQTHLFSKSSLNNDGTVTIPKELVDRWNRQIQTPYAKLSEKEKDSDREFAIEVLDIINNNRHLFK